MIEKEKMARRIPQCFVGRRRAGCHEIDRED